MGAPGVKYKQKDLSQVVVGVDSAVLGACGTAKWGPSDELTPLDNLKYYTQQFGVPVDPATTPAFYQLYGWFKLGKSCYFVRPQGGSLYGGVEAEKSTIPAAIATGIADLPLAPTATNVLGLYTKYAGVHDVGDVLVELFDVDDTSGTFGIRAGVVTDTAGALDTGNDWFEEHRVAIQPSVKDGQGRTMFVEDVLDRDSQLLAGRAKAGALVDDVPAETTVPIQLAGNIYVAATEGEIMLGYNMFKSVDAVTIDLIIPTTFTEDVMARVAEVAIDRGDCFYILSPAVGETWTVDGITGTTGWLSTLTKSWQGAAYAMYYKVKDEYNDRDVYVPSAGFIAGAYSYNDAQAAQWYAPAGPRRGIQTGVSLGHSWLISDRNTIYDRDVNFVANSARYGVTIEGQKTLYGVNSALDRVNVARLMLKIRRDLTTFLQDFVYEFNNIKNRTAIFNGIDGYLRNIKSREGLYDYRIVCDDTNNPPSVIDQNKLIVDIYLQPVKVAEELYLQTTITSTEVDLSQVVSQAA